MATAFTTAIEAWDKRWATAEGRADWLDPEPDVIALLPELKARGARTALDLGCGVGRHALLLAEHGLAVEALDGSAAGLAVVRETAQARGISLGVRQGTADALPFDGWQLRFRAVVERDPPRDLGRCRAAAGRDLARAEAQGTLSGHDAADAQHQLRTRPHCPPPTPLSATPIVRRSGPRNPGTRYSIAMRRRSLRYSPASICSL